MEDMGWRGGLVAGLMVGAQDCGKLCCEFAGMNIFIGVKKLDQ